MTDFTLTREVNLLTIFLMTDKHLLVITGPTAVGKTDLSIKIAKELKAEIISADARQFYRELKIGTAVPSNNDLKAVPHHFIGHLSIHDYYNVALYEQDALATLWRLFGSSDCVLLVGGSGLYIDTLCHGIDDMPDYDPELRASVQKMYQQEGLEGIRNRLKHIDPEYYDQVDLANPKRMIRALEVCMTTGKTYSELRKRRSRKRPFRIKPLILNRPRTELFERINSRVDNMIQEGLIEEALRFHKYRHLNALNTVGYKELFDWMAGRWTLQTAIEKIKTNSRRYAKRQLTWFKRYDDAKYFNPNDYEEILNYLKTDMAASCRTA